MKRILITEDKQFLVSCEHAKLFTECEFCKPHPTDYGVTMIDEQWKDLVGRAYDVAAKAHEGQKYGTNSYTYHLRQVYDILQEWGVYSAEVLAAGFLHDTIEDTDLTLDEILTKFGYKVTEIVWRVTDEPGSNRKERKEKTYPKIKNHIDAITVKLADRIANVEESKKNNKSLFKMYKKEHKEFWNAIRPDKTANHIIAMYNHLEKLLYE